MSGKPAFVIVAALAMAALPMAVAATPLVASNASQVVTVTGIFLATGSCVGNSVGASLLVTKDGSSAFVIPAGEVFVITSGEFHVVTGSAGNSVGIVLRIGGVEVMATQITLGATGLGATSFVAPSGIVAATTDICTGSTDGYAELFLHGFYAKDK